MQKTQTIFLPPFNIKRCKQQLLDTNFSEQNLCSCIWQTQGVCLRTTGKHSQYKTDYSSAEIFMAQHN